MKNKYWWIGLAFAIVSACLLFSGGICIYIYQDPSYLALCFLGLGMFLVSSFFVLIDIGEPNF